MICPNCGADIDLFLRQKAYEEERKETKAKREKEFEQIYGETLRSIRRRRTWVGVIMGAIFTTGAIVAFTWFLFSLFPGGVMGFWENLKIIPWPVILLFLLLPLLVIVVGAGGGLVISKKRGKQEQELRKSFGF